VGFDVRKSRITESPNKKKGIRHQKKGSNQQERDIKQPKHGWIGISYRESIGSAFADLVVIPETPADQQRTIFG